MKLRVLISALMLLGLTGCTKCSQEPSEAPPPVEHMDEAPPMDEQPAPEEGAPADGEAAPAEEM